MTMGVRFAAAGVCFVAGVLVAWAIHRHEHVTRAPLPATATAARAAA